MNIQITKNNPLAPANPRGFTLIESLVIIVILSIVGVGVGVGLQSSTKLPEATDRALALSAELNSELEAWKAVAWTSSTWPTILPYSKNDTVTINVDSQAITYPRTISIAKWDPNNLSTNTSPQTNFVQVSVTVNGETLLCYLTNPN